jgi:DNA-binding NarL/FixJ family response regulator
MKHNILIADDHSIVRQGVEFMLKTLSKSFKVFHAWNYKGIFDILDSESIHLLICDIQMPDFGGFQQIIDIRIKYPTLKILIFSGQDESLYSIKYLQNGADGYLDKNTPESEFIKAIEAILIKGKYISPKSQELLLNNISNVNNATINPSLILSKREIEVCKLIMEGKGNLEISHILNVHANTISTYKSRIFDKLNVDNVIDMIKVFKSI